MNPTLAAPALVAACERQQPARTPVWFMRQAGRSLPEYRAARRDISMLDACRDPELVTELTLQPIRRYDVDAAVLFSDIMVPVHAAGIDLEFVAGRGPVLAEPVRTRHDLQRLRPLDTGDLDFVTAAVTATVAELGGTPLIGFSGAPFTLLSYLIEGGPSRHLERTRALMHTDERLWRELMERVSGLAITFLQTQIAAGTSAVQLFDTWAGALSRADYARFVLPHTRTVLHAARQAGVPIIHFGLGLHEVLDLIAGAGADVLSVDWRIDITEAVRRSKADVAIQGNLDPTLLGAPWPVIEQAARRVLAQGAAAPGHIFNLGHGVPPDTDPNVLHRLVNLVHGDAP